VKTLLGCQALSVISSGATFRHPQGEAFLSDEVGRSLSVPNLPRDKRAAFYGGGNSGAGATSAAGGFKGGYFCCVHPV
jgi:hypothetical protein